MATLSNLKTNYHADENGYYGNYGGAYVPELLEHNLKILRESYLKITADPEFQKAFKQLLSDYVGRPTPLYFAKGLSKKYSTKFT